MTCAGEEHKNCAKLVVADLDAVLERTGFGLLPIDNPLKALLTTFLLKSDAVASASAGKKLITQILETDAGWELGTYCSAREDDVKSGAFPSEADVESALKIWVKRCQIAHEEVKKSGFGPITIGMPEALPLLPEVERSGMKNALEKSAFLLKKIRAITKTLVTEQRVILGDSSAYQLKKLWIQSAFVGTQEGSISEVIRNFDEVVLSSKVKWLIVMVGKDLILADESIDSLIEKVKRLRQLCTRFSHVKVYWLLPPFISDKKIESEEFCMRMRALFRKKTQIELITITEDGRSLLELWRFGQSFNNEHVTHHGWMTEKGLKILKAWLTAIIPGFPGDRELGIRLVKSKAVTPKATGKLKGGGPGDPSLSRDFVQE